MELHKQTGDIISSTLTNTTLSLSKQQASLANVQAQLKLEKVSSFEKDRRIKTLEDLVVNIGYDPSNVNAIEEIIKKKNVDIATLRKQLKIPATKDPLVKDIEENETQKIDKMKLIMEHNAQLKKME